MENPTKRRTRLLRSAAVLAVGVAIGTVMMATPAAAHFQQSISHVWSHIKPKADDRYANAVAGTDRAKNANKLLGRNWSKFLNDVVVVVESSGSIANGGFDTEVAVCPSGYKVIAGGVDPQNVASMQVTSSAPTTTEHTRLYANTDGVKTPNGWHGAVVNNTGSTQNPGFKVAAVCAKAYGRGARS